MKVINLFAGPGAGKSTTAAGVFHALKSKDINCELVTEYAKDVVWEGRDYLLKNQIYIFAKQLHRLDRLRGKVDIAVTDCPLLLSTVYAEDRYSEAFHCLVLEQFSSFENKNIFIKREKKFNPKGRLQTEVEAIALDLKIKQLLLDNRLEFIEKTSRETVNWFME